MTAAPSPASAEPVPTGRRRGPIAPRPDDRLVLLEAIQRQDAPQARRLAERWVHRCGLASLEASVNASFNHPSSIMYAYINEGVSDNASLCGA